MPVPDDFDFSLYDADPNSGLPLCTNCGLEISPPTAATLACRKLWHNNEAPAVIGNCGTCGEQIRSCEGYTQSPPDKDGNITIWHNYDTPPPAEQVYDPSAPASLGST